MKFEAVLEKVKNEKPKDIFVYIFCDLYKSDSDKYNEAFGHFMSITIQNSKNTKAMQKFNNYKTHIFEWID